MTKTNQTPGRGGARIAGPGKKLGRPPYIPDEEKRIRVSTRLAPGTKILAEKIAKTQDLPGWGRAVDLAIQALAKELGLTE